MRGHVQSKHYVLTNEGYCFLSPISPQNQYVFIHDALNDFLTCGDTSILAHELRRTISTMSQTDVDGETGFQKQFEVRPYMLVCDL